MTLGLAAVLALATLPAFALPPSLVYVPVIAEDRHEVVQIVVTNTDPDAVRNFRTYFLPLNASGLAERTDQGKSYSVAPGQTMIFEQKATVPGVLEITANASLSIAAQRTPFPGSRLKVEVPVVSSQNLVQASSRMHINEWSRTTSGIQSDLGLMNLSEQEMECQAEVFEADGDQIATGALLRLKPMSVAHYADALNLLGRSSINNARVELVCDRDSFAWTEVIDRQNDLVTFRQPSTSSSTKRGVGGGDDGGGDGDTEVDPDGTIVFERGGNFFTASPQEPTRAYNIAVPPNTTFSKMTLEVDVYHGGWSHDPHENHSLFWIHRGGWLQSKWLENIFGFANVFGPNKNLCKVVHNIGAGSTRSNWENPSSGCALQKGNTYRVRFVWDDASDLMGMTIVDKSTGAQVTTTTGSTRNQPLRSDASGFFFAYFGHEDLTGHGPERPSYGWKWSDLTVKFFP